MYCTCAAKRQQHHFHPTTDIGGSLRTLAMKHATPTRCVEHHSLASLAQCSEPQRHRPPQKQHIQLCEQHLQLQQQQLRQQHAPQQQGRRQLLLQSVAAAAATAVAVSPLLSCLPAGAANAYSPAFLKAFNQALSATGSFEVGPMVLVCCCDHALAVVDWLVEQPPTLAAPPPCCCCENHALAVVEQPPTLSRCPPTQPHLACLLLNRSGTRHGVR